MPTPPAPTLRAAILGATGAVGQTFVRLLAGHPQFEVVSLVASERSAGKPYREAARWLQAEPLDERIGGLVVEGVDAAPDADVVFSGLDASVAGDVEADWARRGYAVVSNARNWRLDPAVPLLIPEVNPDHLALVDRQDWGGAAGGFVVTNPNCSTVGLALALKPLHDAFGVDAVHVVTMQALSGAGYPGVPALDALGNVVPFIAGEEEKLAVETRKILGTLGAAGVADAEITVSAQCHRVPVVDGHLEAVSVRLREPAGAADVAEALRSWRGPLAGLGLPTAPPRPLAVFDDDASPQPRTHVNLGGGMTVSVGRVQDCPVLGVKFVVLSHNTVRGAAGGAVLNAELLAHEGRLAGAVA
ncbi:aspartate-semialdehyde dehydrogenase [Rubrivirga sp. S365]|uniref:Aspartate-semialdehyde dehydrogenase n=1 Tax=Rubrivirga litoralis TaxID=3075598 RepID=A0ABU3BT99_9BACT|nr:MULTISPECIES: aspartate-semialdehyde dehydrogenase [unclassified Rubrivirga]MDT0632520.1 aspartate-semialdehyde dehydrogenase [Rubrivirga sp. F394]MDT7856985.1 aspartate-semialdehyde dehydrogenase [Rubrivirga sp. S365]